MSLIEKPFDWGQLKRLFSYMKPYKKQMLPIIIIMMLVGAITKLTVPLLIREAIDNAIIPKDKNLLFLIVGIMLAVYLIHGSPIHSVLNIRI